MKKLYTLMVAGLVGVQSMDAQFTMLRQHHEPTSSSGFNTADMIKYDSISAIPRGTGQGVSWDFSQMLISTTKITLNYVAPSAAPAAASFTAATIASNHGNNMYSYYRQDSTANPPTFQLLGMSSGSTVISSLSDPAVHMQWPVTYGANWNDSYSGSLPMPVVGNYSANATGLGNLTLVGGKQFPNSMQISVWDSLTVTTGTTVTRSLTRWHNYYHANNRYPILKFGQNSTNGGAATYTILVNWLEAVGLTDNNFDASYAMYPNPATNLLHVKLSNSSAYTTVVSIQNLTGAEVKRYDLGKGDVDSALDISDLANGVYLVKTASGDRFSTRKLIKE